MCSAQRLDGLLCRDPHVDPDVLQMFQGSARFPPSVAELKYFYGIFSWSDQSEFIEIFYQILRMIEVKTTESRCLVTLNKAEV